MVGPAGAGAKPVGAVQAARVRVGAAGQSGHGIVGQCRTGAGGRRGSVEAVAPARAIEQGDRYRGARAGPQRLGIADEALGCSLPGEAPHVVEAARLDRAARSAVGQPVAHAVEECLVVADRDALVADGFLQREAVAGQEGRAAGLRLDGGDAENLGKVGRIDDELALGHVPIQIAFVERSGAHGKAARRQVCQPLSAALLDGGYPSIGSDG